MGKNPGNKLNLFRDKMYSDGLPDVVVDTFAHYYQQVASGETGLIRNADISALEPDDIVRFEELASYADTGRKLSNQAIMIRLNGGLGTSMGLAGPKSLLPVKQGKSFLEIIMGQALHQGVTLALMNSFNTHQATVDAIRHLDAQSDPLMFIQNKFPKIFQSDLRPANWPQAPLLEWNPPGHGDIFTALFASGMLIRLLDQGIKYAFIANSDNLGATMDAGLLGYFAENRLSFMMEVAEKTPSDIKGGHIARHNNGRLVLRESAQCHESEIEAFQDIGKFRFFNTNNIWVALDSIRTLIETEGAIYLPIIVNPKTVDPRDKNSPPVYQIETAMGAAISLFDQAAAVRVPRSRFMPVKKCPDLLAVRSDCFILNDDCNLQPNPNRRLPPLKVRLDNRYFQQIDDFDARFPAGAPSMIDCETLEIEGDVGFESRITLKGRVVIKNQSPSQKVITTGTVIDNQEIV